MTVSCFFWIFLTNYSCRSFGILGLNKFLSLSAPVFPVLVPHQARCPPSILGGEQRLLLVFQPGEPSSSSCHSFPFLPPTQPRCNKGHTRAGKCNCVAWFGFQFDFELHCLSGDWFWAATSVRVMPRHKKIGIILSQKLLVSLFIIGCKEETKRLLTG